MPGKVVAIDPGTRRIGVAVSDPDGKVALPLGVIEAESIEDELIPLITQQGANEVVVGLPKRLDGTDGLAAQSARELAALLQSRLEVPVRLVDERLTTAAADKAFTEMDVSERKRRKSVDKVAATLLLQTYLDSRA
jgi:putative pre-16S rRNA nuclease